jgi:hypothetical protein
MNRRRSLPIAIIDRRDSLVNLETRVAQDGNSARFVLNTTRGQQMTIHLAPKVVNDCSQIFSATHAKMMARQADAGVVAKSESEARRVDAVLVGIVGNKVCLTLQDESGADVRCLIPAPLVDFLSLEIDRVRPALELD